VDGTDVPGHLDQTDGNHQAAVLQNVARVPAYDTVVDDVGVEGGQIKGGAGLQELKQHQQRDGFSVGTQVGPQES
jgi:hypothetical protein